MFILGSIFYFLDALLSMNVRNWCLTTPCTGHNSLFPLLSFTIDSLNTIGGISFVYYGPKNSNLSNKRAKFASEIQKVSPTVQYEEIYLYIHENSYYLGLMICFISSFSFSLSLIALGSFSTSISFQSWSNAFVYSSWYSRSQLCAHLDIGNDHVCELSSD